MSKKESAEITLDVIGSVLVGIVVYSKEATKAETERMRLNIIKNLANERGVANSFTLAKESSGKPFLQTEDSKLHISIAHTRSCEIVAWGGKRPVGVDIEVISRNVSPRLFRRIAHPDQEMFETLTPLVHWVLKEASLKLLGTGLRYAMKNLRLLPDNDPLQFLVQSEDFPLIRAQIKEWNSYLLGVAQFVHSP